MEREREGEIGLGERGWWSGETVTEAFVRRQYVVLTHSEGFLHTSDQSDSTAVWAVPCSALVGLPGYPVHNQTTEGLP